VVSSNKFDLMFLSRENLLSVAMVYFKLESVLVIRGQVRFEPGSLSNQPEWGPTVGQR